MKKLYVGTKKYPNTYTLLDDEDYEYLNQWKWFDRGDGYVLRSIIEEGKSKQLRMHRIIMNAPKGMFVDHIDHNPLNNQKENLRVCTPQQNNLNRKLGKNNKSGHIGVYWNNKSKRWVMDIRKKKIRLVKHYKNKKDAISQYECIARILFGVFFNKLGKPLNEVQLTE